LQASEEGEISVDVVEGEEYSLAGQLCHAIATMLLHNQPFQAELQKMLDEQEGELS
jgi:hypothetical protein